MIRTLLCAAAVVITATISTPPSAQASASPWCAVIAVDDENMYWDCQYRSFEECQPHIIAGNRGFCNQNPAYNGPEQPQRKHPRRRKHAE